MAVYMGVMYYRDADGRITAAAARGTYKEVQQHFMGWRLGAVYHRGTAGIEWAARLWEGVDPHVEPYISSTDTPGRTLGAQAWEAMDAEYRAQGRVRPDVAQWFEWFEADDDQGDDNDTYYDEDEDRHLKRYGGTDTHDEGSA